MAGRYEVLLRRNNGINKTVIIEDCMSESEAIETAESMYGMEALRAIWKGNSNSYTSSSTSSGGSNWSSSTDTEIDGDTIIGLVGIVFIGGLIYLFIHFWWVFLIIGVILGGLMILGSDDE